MATPLRALSADAGGLRYVGVELHPVRVDQFAEAHRAGGIDDAAARAVIGAYAELVGGASVELFGAEGRLLAGGAAERLGNLPRGESFDAIYLDGFTPARNPSLWQPAVFEEVGRLTAEAR